MIGKIFENKHNSRIIVITRIVITDEGYRYWRGEKIDDPYNWSFYTNKDLENHWVEIIEEEEGDLLNDDL